jgi:hypothetical protein
MHPHGREPSAPPAALYRRTFYSGRVEKIISLIVLLSHADLERIGAVGRKI